MERYKDWKMNIKHLTEFLMSYVSAMENEDNLEMERLMTEIEIIFHELSSENNNDSKKEEIVNLILLGMKEKTLTHYDVAILTRDLVIHNIS